MLNKAIQIAAAAHAGQVDKAGEPYILHPLRVMVSGGLREEGFPEEEVAALDCLTRRDGESYDAFILRACKNPIARRVKAADLMDNSDLSRIKHPVKDDIDRTQKYRAALASIAEYEARMG